MLFVSMTTKCVNEETRQTSGVILRNQPPPPPHCWGPGRRKWNSSGKEADVAGGQAPAPAQASADASAAPPVGRQSPRTWRSTMSCSFPATAPSFLFGVNSFWVVSHPKIQCRWGQCVFPQTKSPRIFPDWARRNLNIPVWP